MGRIIGFVGVRTAVGSTTLCYEMAKLLSNRNYKVCALDFYFSMNDLSERFSKESKFDLKDFLTGKIGVDGIIEEESTNLYFMRTNAARFNYCLYKQDIVRLIKMIAYKFDYILIDVNSFNFEILKIVCEIITEVYLIFDNEPNSIKLISRTVKFFKQNSNIDLINFVFNKSKIIGQLNKQYLTRIEIEDIINENIIFEIPKFYNYNNVNNKKRLKFIDKIMNKFCNSFITNKTLHLVYSKRYKGLIGKIKKRLYAKFE